MPDREPYGRLRCPVDLTKLKQNFTDVYINIRIRHYSLKKNRMLEQTTLRLTVVGVKTRLPRKIADKVSRWCQFTLNEPTKRRTGAVEFLKVPKHQRTPYGCHRIVRFWQNRRRTVHVDGLWLKHYPAFRNFFKPLTLPIYIINLINVGEKISRFWYLATFTAKKKCMYYECILTGAGCSNIFWDLRTLKTSTL